MFLILITIFLICILDPVYNSILGVHKYFCSTDPFGSLGSQNNLLWDPMSLIFVINIVKYTGLQNKPIKPKNSYQNTKTKNVWHSNICADLFTHQRIQSSCQFNNYHHSIIVISIWNVFRWNKFNLWINVTSVNDKVRVLLAELWFDFILYIKC